MFLIAYTFYGKNIMPSILILKDFLNDFLKKIYYSALILKTTAFNFFKTASILFKWSSKLLLLTINTLSMKVQVYFKPLKSVFISLGKYQRYDIVPLIISNIQMYSKPRLDIT